MLSAKNRKARAWEQAPTKSTKNPQPGCVEIPPLGKKSTWPKFFWNPSTPEQVWTISTKSASEASRRSLSSSKSPNPGLAGSKTKQFMRLWALLLKDIITQTSDSSHSFSLFLLQVHARKSSSMSAEWMPNDMNVSQFGVMLRHHCIDNHSETISHAFRWWSRS